jgi:predicted permease
MLVDLLHLSRSLRRSPISAAAAIVTLSLTLGAGAAIFAVVDAVLLAPPPFRDPATLVTVGEVPLEDPAAAPRGVPYATFQAWRDRAGSLASLEAFDGTNLTLTELGAAERLTANDVTPGLLPLLGVSPALGRTFADEDVGQPIVIVSHAFWRGKLAADPQALGRTLMLGSRSHTIVGVLPENFSFAFNKADIWRALPLTPAQAAGSGYRVGVLGRLSRQTSPASLAGALDDVSRLSAPPARVVARSVARAIAGEAAATLRLLAAAAALALLIAFTNLAGLLIVRSIDRRRELAVRSALGASRTELARQLLLEAAALVAMGTLGGVLLALWITPATGRLALEQFGGVANRDVAVSWRVIGVLALVAVGCASLCGLVPATRAARWSVIDVLRRGATPSTQELRLRRLFVAGEVALAFVLLVSMALLGRTLYSVLHVNPGFDARNVLTLHVSLPRTDYPGPERATSFYASLQSALQERLGPHAVSVVDELPLTGDRGRSLVSARRTDPGREAVVRAVSPGYFEVMRIPMAAGRSFEPQDDAMRSPRVVISALLAERLFANEPPIGRQIWLASGGQMAEVVGVVGQVAHRALDEVSLPTVYVSALQEPSHSSVIVVRSERPDADVIAAVREEVARLDPKLPVYGVRPMQNIVAASPGVSTRRLLTAAFTGFALLAVVLSTLGLFGVAAHEVACRRSEFALRMALGADPWDILRTTLGRGALMVGAGLASGGVLSIWAVRGLRGVLVGTGSFDLLSVVVAAAIIMAAGAGAILPAALRAARTDPLAALRGQ